MVNVKNIVIGLAVVVAAGLLYNFLVVSEEDAIRKQFGTLSEFATKHADEQQFVSLQKASKISDLFAEPSTLEVTAASFSGEFSRREVKDRAVVVMRSFSQMAVSFHDLNIEVLDGGVANAIATARLTAVDDGEPFTEIHEIEAVLRKIEDVWLFKKLTLIEVLER